MFQLPTLTTKLTHVGNDRVGTAVYLHRKHDEETGLALIDLGILMVPGSDGSSRIFENQNCQLKRNLLR